MDLTELAQNALYFALLNEMIRPNQNLVELQAVFTWVLSQKTASNINNVTKKTFQMQTKTNENQTKITESIWMLQCDTKRSKPFQDG